MKKLNVLGICGGNGVCLFPFREDFNILGNHEPRGVFYDKKQEQWNSNFQGIPQYREHRSYEKRVDVIIGHPDCGDSSVLRMSRAKKAGEVKDNKSINIFLASINVHKPKFWLMENLPGFLKTHSIEDLEICFPKYHILHHISSVSHYGNSQLSRKRLVVIGIRKKYDISALKYFRLPKVNKDKLKFSQDFEMGNHDNETCHVREFLDKTCNLYWGIHRQITYQRALELWNTEFEGKGRWHVGGKMNNQPGVSRNLRDNYPLTVRKQNRQFGTKGLVLSPREMANIQGLPKKFHLVYHLGQSIYWINKGRLTVTKTMPYEIGRWFAKNILKLQNDTKIDKIKTL